MAYSENYQPANLHLQPLPPSSIPWTPALADLLKTYPPGLPSRNPPVETSLAATPRIPHLTLPGKPETGALGESATCSIPHDFYPVPCLRITSRLCKTFPCDLDLSNNISLITFIYRLSEDTDHYLGRQDITSCSGMEAAVCHPRWDYYSTNEDLLFAFSDFLVLLYFICGFALRAYSSPSLRDVLDDSI